MLGGIHRDLFLLLHLLLSIAQPSAWHRRFWILLQLFGSRNKGVALVLKKIERQIDTGKRGKLLSDQNIVYKIERLDVVFAHEDFWTSVHRLMGTQLTLPLLSGQQRLAEGRLLIRIS